MTNDLCSFCTFTTQMIQQNYSFFLEVTHRLHEQFPTSSPVQHTNIKLSQNFTCFLPFESLDSHKEKFTSHTERLESFIALK